MSGQLHAPKEMPTARGVPKRSPIQVLTTPNVAFHSGREADHSPPSSAEVKEWVELYIHSPNTASWRGTQLGGAQGLLSVRKEGPVICFQFSEFFDKQKAMCDSIKVSGNDECTARIFLSFGIIFITYKFS
jgi:hypothetical protein